MKRCLTFLALLVSVSVLSAATPVVVKGLLFREESRVPYVEECGTGAHYLLPTHNGYVMGFLLEFDPPGGKKPVLVEVHGTLRTDLTPDRPLEFAEVAAAKVLDGSCPAAAQPNKSFEPTRMDKVQTRTGIAVIIDKVPSGKRGQLAAQLKR